MCHNIYYTIIVVMLNNDGYVIFMDAVEEFCEVLSLNCK